MGLTYKLKSKGAKELGFLVPLEYKHNLPFEVKRIFYTYDVPFDIKRGAHAYHKTEQVLICIAGSLNIRCFDGVTEKIYKLNSKRWMKVYIYHQRFGELLLNILLIWFF